jgi:plastocyanin
MATRTAQAGLQTAGGAASYVYANSVAGGWIGYVEKTSSTPGITTTETDIVSSGAVTVNASRRIRVTGFIPSWVSTVTGDRVEFHLMEGSTQLQFGRSTTQLAGIATEPPTVMSVLLTPTAGAHTYRTTCTRNQGTGTITVGGAADSPSYILVEDLGPAA